MQESVLCVSHCASISCVPAFYSTESMQALRTSCPHSARQQELVQPKLQKPSETMPTLPDFHPLLFVGLVLTKGPHTCWLARC